jgi:HEAT repeat protein
MEHRRANGFWAAIGKGATMGTGKRRRRTGRWSCLGLLGCWLAAAPLFAADPLEDLKQALTLEDVTNPTEAMLAFRRDNLQKKIDALTTIGQLRRALALDEWRDDPARQPNDKLRPIDTLMRGLVGKRLTEALDQQSKAGDASSRLAVANLIAEMGPNVRALSPDNKSGFARSLTPQVQRLARDADVGVRQEALRALGTINANVTEAAKTFADILQHDKAVGPRRAAAEGLGQLVKVAVDLEKRSLSAADTTGVKVTQTEVLAALRETMLKSPVGFRDAAVEVRARCALAFELAVMPLGDGTLIDRVGPDSDSRKRFPPAGRPLSKEEIDDLELKHQEMKRAIGELRPALEAMRAHAHDLTLLLSDADPAVRFTGIETLKNVALVRQRLRQRVLALPEFPGTTIDHRALLEGIDPLELFLKTDLGAVAPLFSEADMRLRREAAIFLLLLDERALPLSRHLIARLSDSDRSIRWVAARALNNFPPERISEAVPHLARLLTDDDPNARKAAAETLEWMGPLARGALGALGQAIQQGDPEGRIAAVKALTALESNIAQEATPQLIAVLGQPDADSKVLVAVADALAQIGPPARAAVPSLRRLVGHDDSEVRKAASEAILEINRAGKK